MSAKEQLVNVLGFIGENEAEKILLYIRQTFAFKMKTWEDVEEDDPTPDEIEEFRQHRSASAL